MADKVDKPKKSKAKPKKDEKNVLGSLSSTRPDRIGTRRATAAKPAAGATAAKPARATAAKPAAGATAAKPARETASRRKAAAPRTFEPTEAAESAAGKADERAAGVAGERAAGAGAARSATGAARPPAPEREPRPRAVREGAPGMGTSDVRADPTSPPGTGEQPASESARPSGMELVTTAVQAVGELTQIGLTIGGRILKRAIDRLPRP